MAPSVDDRLREIREGTATGTMTVELSRQDVVMLLELAGAALQVDPDYESRKGYDPAFLGETVIPLPSFTDTEREKDRVLISATESAELRYHHFSEVISRSRRLAFVTAVNIDGRKRLSVLRTSDRWIFDPRIPEDLQIGDELYLDNQLDRGHLVRRQDPCRGDAMDQAVAANNDTFHFTNCSPQHAGFNQSPETWHGLEDYIMNNAASKELKVTVFTGPVLAEDDPIYREVALPQQFWKVVSTTHEDGSLCTTAYLLSQQQLIDDLTAEAFTFGAYKTFQAHVEDIERLTGLDFGEPLRSSDPFGVRVAAAARIEVTKLSQIVL
jgi:endonuclease G, mitochondrial